MKNKKKIYFIIAAVAMILVGIKYFDSKRNVQVVEGSVTMCDSEEWTPLLAENINNNFLSVNVDGSKTSLLRGEVYVDDELNTMINARNLTAIFSCATNIIDNHIVLERANTHVDINLNDNTITVDGATETMKCETVKKDGEIFVPLKIMEEYFSYDYQWDPVNYSVSLNNQKPEEKIYPQIYDYRTIGKISSVKDQYQLGTCWAFASLTALETSLMPEEKYDFSEDNLRMHSGYNMDPNRGGQSNMAMAYLASWKGPVLEEQDPYGDDESPDNLEAVKHVQEMRIIDSKDFDGIKKAVFLYGGVQSSLYMSVDDAIGFNTENYNSAKAAYCYIGTMKPNHDVVIIGWDDTYSADNFTTKPEGDGAFICLNSWGEDFGESGYFYVSYYDINIGTYNLVYTVIEDADNYDKIYQSDLCGWVGKLGYNKEEAYFANLYTAQENETLKAVGFYATGAGTDYEVYFVENFEGTDSLNSRIMVASGQLSNAGYYTVKIDSDRYIKAGQKYAVMVYIKTPNAVHPIAVEYAASENTATVDITDGEGYISYGGQTWENVEQKNKCNVCLKAYTNIAK